MNQVYYAEEFISPQYCQHLINFFEKHKSDHGFVFSDRLCINVSSMFHTLSNDDNLNEVDILKKLYGKIEQNIAKIDPDTFVNYAHLVRRDQGASQDAHTDFDHHTWTSVLYLNDNFKGGQTRVETHEFEPDQGSMITFQGKYLEHEVYPVTEGSRYTVLVWYKTLNFSNQ